MDLILFFDVMATPIPQKNAMKGIKPIKINNPIVRLPLRASICSAPLQICIPSTRRKVAGVVSSIPEATRQANQPLLIKCPQIEPTMIDTKAPIIINPIFVYSDSKSQIFDATES